MAQTKIKFSIEGGTEIRAQLDGLKYGIGRRIVRNALAKATTPLLKAMKRNAPQGPTGNLKAALTKRIKLFPDGNVAAYVGTTRGKRGSAIAWLVEYGGHAPRRAKGKVLADGRDHYFGKEVKRMPAHPFMRPAFDATIGEVQRILEEGIREGTERALAKAGIE